MITLLKNTVNRVLPVWALNQLSRARKRYRRFQWESYVAAFPDSKVTCEQLIADFLRLGVQAGRDLILHSALSKVGMVEGGPLTIIHALREVLGPDATLLMPVYPMKLSMLETMRDPEPFDVKSSPSFMGKITELFRQLPDVERSAHPTHSVASQGPRAHEYVAYHHESKSPCGPGSPFRLLADHNGQILCLGTGIGKVTSHHVIEDMVPDFPIQVYLLERFAKPVILANGEKITVEVKVHNPALSSVRVDHNAKKETEILDAMRRRQMVGESSVGKAKTYLFGASALNDLHRSLLKKGITIYER